IKDPDGTRSKVWEGATGAISAAWGRGDYGEAVGRVTAIAASLAIPGAGGAGVLGKIGSTLTRASGRLSGLGGRSTLSGLRDALLGARGLARPLSFEPKIQGQMAKRGWTLESVEETVRNPAATHPVWDLTVDGKVPATAFERGGGGYVVVNDESGAVVQISDLTDAGWKAVWNDSRFQR
ncbi:MAG: colicin E5-related ribonuclease, partial [Candidatus Nanopelagicales bacterium]|nr:colicin E5-related ribonuclease [Candidatus Nanopelagicales bacterium]